MRKVLLLLGLLCSMTMSAQQVEKVGTVALGLPYAEALTAIKAEFGEPQSVSDDQVVYGKKTFMGMAFDEVKFRFRNGKFNEARFFCKVGSKAAAQKKMEEMAKTLGKTYNLSRDVEDDMTWFYKGGRSPLGIGHLFTLYTYAKQGAHGAELRYGPINFRD